MSIWYKDEEDQLVKEINDGYEYSAIAEIHKRTELAIKSRVILIYSKKIHKEEISLEDAYNITWIDKKIFTDFMETNKDKLEKETPINKTQSKKKETYYAVKEGMKNGIFRTWNECKEQVSGYSGAKYKKFDNLQDAEEFLNGGKEEVYSDDAIEFFGSIKWFFWWSNILVNLLAVVQSGYNIA